MRSHAWNFKDLSGVRFTHWLIVRIDHRKKQHTFWKCKCDCGNESLVSSSNLIARKSTQCLDCRRGDKTRIRNPFEYASWIAMNGRCSRHPKYRSGKITICERWSGKNGFKNFLIDMGKKPTRRHSIERKDNNGNYEPNNCKWATFSEQANNKSNSKKLSFHGITLTFSQWGKRTGLSNGAIGRRIRAGWTVEQTLLIKSSRVHRNHPTRLLIQKQQVLQ